MKKILSLLMLLVAIVTGAWAGTETPGNSGTADTQLTGTSYSIGGTYIAGAGSTKIGDMETKGVKIRTNKNSNTLVISVNEGYRIDGLTIYGVSNDSKKAVDVSGVSIDGVAQTFTSVTFPNKNSTECATIALTDIAATNNITLSFGTNAGTQLNFDLHFTYTQTEVITQEITAASIYGAALSAEQLATLKSTKALTIDGSSYNGVGVLGVTLNSGAVTPTMAISGNNAVYTFSLNSGADEYTVTVTGVKKTYTAQGSVVYYDADALSNSEKTLTIDDIAFNYASKTFGHANNTAGVTIGSTTYKPIKLSTGEAVTVTFPTGKVATKIIVYGWSNSGNGKLVNFTDGGEKSIDTSGDIFYGEDLAANVYPSVYEYDVDNWEAFTFQGNGGQPYVVFDFVLANAGPVDPTFTLSSEEVEVGSAISVNGPAGLSFNAEPVSGTTGAVSVSGSTITGVTAGAAQVRVTSAATSEYNAYDHTFDITVTAPVCATPVISPATFTADNQEVTITSETAGATIYYTTDGTDPTESSNEYDPESKPTVSSTTTFKAIAVKENYDDSEVATQKITRTSSAVVASWDFTKWSSETQAGVRADGTNWRDYETSKTDKPLNDKVYSNKVANATFVYSETTIPETKGLSFATTAYTFGLAFDQSSTTIGTYHGSEYLWLYGSNSTITIPSLSAGSTIEIGLESHKINGTDDATRTLTVTNTNEGSYSTETYTEQTFTVTADGNVTITPSKGMHIYYITVTSNVETEGITTDNDVATYVTKNALDFTGLETKAYVVKSIDTKKNKVFTEEVTTVPAGTALLVKGATVNVPVIASATAPATNLLQISNGSVTGAAGNIFAYSKSSKQFKKVASTVTIPSGKCYLEINGGTESLDVDFEDEATAINNVDANENANSAAPVKVIKNGKLYIGNYNLAGQLVK